ncbi:hypothetical protein K4H00_25935, partial [Mycobacterium tuberculosis]|nr:hypothetical protein [Mycobacterium tuberculosis]
DGTMLTPQFCLRRRPDGGYTVTLRAGEAFDIVPDAFRFLRQYIQLIRKNFSDFKLSFGSEFRAAWQREKPRPATEPSVYE